jgi:hypothetical protein
LYALRVNLPQNHLSGLRDGHNFLPAESIKSIWIWIKSINLDYTD